ncbi:MAG: hypothetical protein RL417_2613 [Pseudomonadota bacterium]|jgi:pSer/pThr/pTyr-binding forkhead associated (FHA) protein
MAALVLEELRTEGKVELGRLEEGEVVVGREPAEGIAIDNGAISRNHGVFARIRDHWFYKDLGSTNGSWHNGTQLKGNQWRLVRSGDIIQVADTAIRVSTEDGRRTETMIGLPSIGGRSLLVFSKGDFIDEFPVPEYGRALVVGGSKADLALEADLAELPSLVVERRGDNICAFRLAKESRVVINDRELGDLVNLTDGDEIRVGDYQIMMNDPAALQRRERSVDRLTGTVEPLVAGGGRRAARDWSSDGEGNELTRTRSTVRIPFGQTNFGEEANGGSIDTHELEEGGYDRHPSMRFTLEEPSSSVWSTLEDKVIIVVGLLLIVALMVLALWWVLA